MHPCTPLPALLAGFAGGEVAAAPGAATAEAAPAASAAGPDARATAFRAVKGGAEVQSGELLLIEAYAAFWLIAFGLVYLSLRRQKRLDQRIDALAVDLSRHRTTEPGSGRKDGGGGEG